MNLFYDIEDAPLIEAREEEALFNASTNGSERQSTIAVKEWHEEDDLGISYEFSGKSYRLSTHINYVITPASNQFAAVQLKANGKRKVLLPYQTAGVVTAPGDIPNGYRKNFWERLFKAFFDFLSLPFKLMHYTWDFFTKTLVGDGSPQNISKAWISESDLYRKKINVPLKSNPLVPADIVPIAAYRQGTLSTAQTGLGLFVRSNGVYRQQIDSNRILRHSINYPSIQKESPAWNLDPFASELKIGWLSNDHGSNDGSIYGSFAVFEEY